jgi:hypothetical protein
MCTWSSGQTVVAGSCCGRRNKNRIGGKSGINKGYLKFSRQFECFQLRLGNTTIILLLKGCGLQNKSFRILKCILTRVGEVGFNVFCSLMLTFFSQLQLKLYIFCILPSFTFHKGAQNLSWRKTVLVCELSK